MLSFLLTALVALEHFWIMILEMVLWTKPIGQKTFRRSPEEQQSTVVLAANQGLYNGFLAVGLAWSLMPGHADAGAVRTFFLGCVTVAGVFGGITVMPRVALVQALPAALALAATLLRM